MATIQLPPDFKEFLKLLNSSNVEYLVVGGYAVNYYGDRFAKTWDSHHISPHSLADSMDLPSGRNAVAVPVFAPTGSPERLPTSIFGSRLALRTLSVW